MKDLVLEAVKAFPVWPADGWNGLEKGKQVIGLCLEDYSEALESYETGNYYQIGIECNKRLWQIACTREQHIRKRIELIDNCKTFTGIALLPSVMSSEFEYIAEIDRKNKALDDVTDTDVGEWGGEGLPPVGTVCEYYDAIPKTWRTIAIVAHHINGEEAIWSESIEGGQLFYGTPSDFRPLKPEAEKERELLEEKMYRDAQLADCVNFTKGMAKVLIAAGWRPTNEIASLVMKSCYKHGAGDYWREIAADVLEGMGQVESRKKLTGREND